MSDARWVDGRLHVPADWVPDIMRPERWAFRLGANFAEAGRAAMMREDDPDRRRELARLDPDSWINGPEMLRMMATNDGPEQFVWSLIFFLRLGQ